MGTNKQKIFNYQLNQMSHADYLKAGQVTVFSKSYCPFCPKAINVFKEMNISPKVYECDLGEVADGVENELKSKTKQNTFPQVFVGLNFVGGCDSTFAAKKNGGLETLLKQEGLA